MDEPRLSVFISDTISQWFLLLSLSLSRSYILSPLVWPSFPLKALHLSLHRQVQVSAGLVCQSAGSWCHLTCDTPISASFWPFALCHLNQNVHWHLGFAEVCFLKKSKLLAAYSLKYAHELQSVCQEDKWIFRIHEMTFEVMLLCCHSLIRQYIIIRPTAKNSVNFVNHVLLFFNTSSS